MYKQQKLPNGLRIIMREEKSRESVAIGFWVGVGGRFESDRLKGAAHFLEHIVFKGSKQYSCEQIKQSIEGVGGALNAFTSEEQTCYYAKVPAKHLNTAFDTLADMVFFPKIPKGETEKEKGVIIEEIKMYHDLPQHYVMELLDSIMWPGHPLGKSLAGSAETVAAMSNMDLKRFHRTHYATENIVIALCGNFDTTQITKLIEKKLGKLSKNPQQTYAPWDSSSTQAQTIYENRAIEQMHLAFGVEGFNENDPKRHVLSLINVMLGANMSSRLFVELREKRGLAYSVSSGNKALHDTGVFLIRAGVESTKIVESVDIILRQLKRIASQTVAESEFKRAKEYLLGQLLLGLEDTMDHMLWIGESMIALNKVQTRAKIVKEIEAITPKDVKSVARAVFDPQKFKMAVIGPLSGSDQKTLDKLLRFSV